MKSFTKGILIGVGIGMLFAPMKGEELRRVLAERITEWRNSLPEDSWINQYANQVSARVTSARENWRDYAQQAASKAKQTGQDMASRARHTSQDLTNRARQAKQTRQIRQERAKQTVGFAGSVSSDARVVPEVEINE